MADEHLRSLARDAYNDPHAEDKLRHERCRQGECCAHRIDGDVMHVIWVNGAPYPLRPGVKPTKENFVKRLREFDRDLSESSTIDAITCHPSVGLPTWAREYREIPMTERPFCVDSYTLRVFRPTQLMDDILPWNSHEVSFKQPRYTHSEQWEGINPEDVFNGRIVIPALPFTRTWKIELQAEVTGDLGEIGVYAIPADGNSRQLICREPWYPGGAEAGSLECLTEIKVRLNTETHIVPVFFRSRLP